MPETGRQAAAVYMPLLAIGVGLNTLGIVFQSLGWARYVMMGAGLSMMLICVVKLVAARE